MKAGKQRKRYRQERRLDKSCPCTIAVLGEEKRKLYRADFLIFLKKLLLHSSSN